MNARGQADPWPLGGHVITRTRDFEEMRHRVRIVFCPHEAWFTTSDTTLAAEQRGLRLRHTTPTITAYGGDVTVRVDELPLYALQIPLRGTAAVWSGAERVASGVACASTPSADDTFAMRMPRDCVQLIWAIDTVLVREYASLLVAEDVGGSPVRLELGLDLSAQRGKLVRRLVKGLLDCVQRNPRCATDPLLIRNVEGALATGLLRAQWPGYRQAAAAALPASRPVVAEAMERLAAGPERFAAFPDLAGAVGVSAPALQAGFRRAGVSAERFHTAALQRHVYQRLYRTDPTAGRTVGDVCDQFGVLFRDAFAIGYRQHFGETMEQTLARE